MVSKLRGTETKGRVYITLLNPPYNKKFGNFTKELFDVILKILDNKEIVKKIEDEVLNDKLDNAYMIMNKYISN